SSLIYEYLLPFSTRRSSDLKQASSLVTLVQSSARRPASRRPVKRHNTRSVNSLQVFSKHPSASCWRMFCFQQTSPPHISHITRLDRKSTRLNSSHVSISYAV